MIYSDPQWKSCLPTSRVAWGAKGAYFSRMTMLADNLAMARLARSAGAEFNPPTGGTVRAELNLTPELWEPLIEIGSLRRLAAGAIPAA